MEAGYCPQGAPAGQPLLPWGVFIAIHRKFQTRRVAEDSTLLYGEATQHRMRLSVDGYTVANAACLLPLPQPSPHGEGAVLRQIQITAAISHMDSYETVAIFAANAFPPPVGEGLGGGSRQQLGRFGILSGCCASYGLEGSLLEAVYCSQGAPAGQPLLPWGVFTI